VGLIVVDTTVLMHAVGDEHPLRQSCRRLVDALGNGFEATTTVEVIQEFTHVRSRRRSRQDAARLALMFAGLLAPLLAPTESDLVDGLGIFEGHQDLGAFDSVLAAACLSRSAQLVSADRAFASVAGLNHVVPGSPEFDALLG
jgi:predicted nucleic acid-binding protein